MNDSQKYNGWTNYPTWAVKLWIDNDQGSQEYWEEQTKEAESISNLADTLKMDIEEFAPQMDSNMYGDLMTWAIGMTNWYEIAKAMWEDWHEDEEVTEDEDEE